MPVETWMAWQGVSQTAATSTQIWQNWTVPSQLSQLSGTWGSNSAVMVWADWASTPYAPAVTASAPPSELYGTRLGREEFDRQRAEEATALVEKTKARDAKARELLLAVLDEQQQVELDTHGYFHVTTREGERVYRLGPRTTPTRVKGEDGHRWAYCIHPREQFPRDDNVVALKLLLDSDEEAFLRIANASMA